MNIDPDVASQRLAHDRRVAAAHLRRLGPALHQVDVDGPATRGLEPQRPGPRVQVENARPAHEVARVEGREDRFAHAVARGPRAALRHLQGEGSGRAGDDSGHRSTIAGRPADVGGPE